MGLAESPDDGAFAGGAMEGAVILVGPIGGGWCVQCRGACEALMFLSGGRAERHARALAKSLAGLGQDVLVELHDRQNSLAGVVRFAGAANG